MQLTDAQVMTLAMAIIVPLSLLIYSNSQITDSKEALRAETAKLGAELRAEMAGFRADMAGFRSDMELLRRNMNDGFTRIETAMKIHILEHHR